MLLLRLFYEFFKVGLFSVGGGLATLPFLYNLSDTMGWFTHNDVANMIAIAESTPGAIGVNMASYAGYQTSGIAGAFAATLGLISPSIIIILVIARLLTKFKENQYVDAAFFGLRPASIALISVAGIGVVKIALLNIPAFQASNNIMDLFVFKGLILAVAIYFIQKKTKCHPILLIVLSGIVGIIFQFGM